MFVLNFILFEIINRQSIASTASLRNPHQNVASPKFVLNNNNNNVTGVQGSSNQRNMMPSMQSQTNNHQLQQQQYQVNDGQQQQQWNQHTHAQMIAKTPTVQQQQQQSVNQQHHHHHQQQPQQQQQVQSHQQHNKHSQQHQSHHSSTSHNGRSSSDANEIVIAGRFKLIKKLGKGSFGIAYEGIDLLTNTRIALKLERKRDNSSNREIQILEKLESCKRVPKLLWNGNYKQYRAMALELQGANLCTLFEEVDRKFSLKTAIHIMIECINCMEQVHSRGVVHRDIKPQNFIIGINDQSKIFCIDFGLSSWFINCLGNHIPYQENCSPVGTARYASLCNHRGIHQTRRDDLESIGYMIVYFLKGELPWQGLKEHDRVKKWKKIENKKASVSNQQLTQGLPHEFCYYLDYVKKLKFDQRPDYEKLRKVFRKLYQACGFKNDKIFDWNANDDAATVNGVSTVTADNGNINNNNQ